MVRRARRQAGSGFPGRRGPPGPITSAGWREEGAVQTKSGIWAGAARPPPRDSSCCPPASACTVRRGKAMAGAANLGRSVELEERGGRAAAARGGPGSAYPCAPGRCPQPRRGLASPGTRTSDTHLPASPRLPPPGAGVGVGLPPRADSGDRGPKALGNTSSPGLWAGVGPNRGQVAGRACLGRIAWDLRATALGSGRLRWPGRTYSI